MKINRPEGISQANRSNPYFIILRRVSDIQIQLAEKCAKTFVENLAISSILCVSMVLISAIILVLTTSTTLTMMITIVNAIGSCLLFKCLEDIKSEMYGALSKCTYKDVDQMIFTNEYQTASINQEMIFNMFQDASEVNGDLRTILKCLKMQREWVILCTVLEIGASILIAYLYSLI